MDEMRAIINLIEGSLSELLESRRTNDLSRPFSLYRECLIQYLQADIPGLAQTVLSLSDECAKIGAPKASPESNELKKIYQLATVRLNIRKRSVDELSLSQLKAFAEEGGVWDGECRFVLGLAAEIREDQVLAKESYRRASVALDRIGAHRKAAKALLNHVASESRIRTDRKLIVDYHYVYRKAYRIKEFGTAGVALYNISQEYFSVGALTVALKYCNKSLALLSRDVGSLNYYLALVHRAHVFTQLDRRAEAQIDLEQASICDFPEVTAAMDVVRSELGDSSPLRTDPSALLPTWKERLAISAKKGNRPVLGELESKLVKLIGRKSMDKFELIERLYGKNESFLVLENRLKNSLSRIRKKYPDLIVLDDGKYRVSDDTFLDEAG